MNKVKTAVTGISKKEYLEAGHRNALRMYGMLAVIMVFICGALTLASQNVTIMHLLWPIFVYVAVVVIYEAMIVLGYKGQFESIDPIEYAFTEKGWSVSSNGKTNEFEWKKTPKLVKTKLGIYVYNDATSSCMIPFRYLTEEETSQILSWYEASREEAKKFAKMIEEQSRAQKKSNLNKNNPFSGRGMGSRFGK